MTYMLEPELSASAAVNIGGLLLLVSLLAYGAVTLLVFRRKLSPLSGMALATAGLCSGLFAFLFFAGVNHGVFGFVSEEWEPLPFVTWAYALWALLFVHIGLVGWIWSFGTQSAADRANDIPKPRSHRRLEIAYALVGFLSFIVPPVTFAATGVLGLPLWSVLVFLIVMVGSAVGASWPHPTRSAHTYESRFPVR